MKTSPLICVRSAGEQASGVIHRLHSCGFKVLVLETSKPSTVRLTVSFSLAAYEGTTTVEGATCIRCSTDEEVYEAFARGVIPLLVDPSGDAITRFKPDIVVDAILSKVNAGGTHSGLAPLVIGLGPGLSAPEHCHAVIETNRGHDLGRIITLGMAAPDTGVPGTIAGVTSDRVLRSPCAGTVEVICPLRSHVVAGDEVCRVGGVSVRTPIAGVVRGMIRQSFDVPSAGYKIGDVDPRDDVTYANRISDKARNVSGAVLQVIVSWMLKQE